MTALYRRRSAFLAWVAGLALLIWVLHRVSLGETWSVLRQLDAAAILMLILANGLVLLTLSGRWWLILRAQGFPIPYLTLASFVFLGLVLCLVVLGQHGVSQGRSPASTAEQWPPALLFAPEFVGRES